MWKWWVLFVLVVIILGSSNSGNPRPNLRVIVEAEIAIKEMLKEPESANFRNTFTSKGVACGEVNSKNSFGGYGGWQGFISNGSSITILEEQVGGNEFKKLWRTYCINQVGES